MQRLCRMPFRALSQTQGLSCPGHTAFAHPADTMGALCAGFGCAERRPGHWCAAGVGAASCPVNTCCCCCCRWQAPAVSAFSSWGGDVCAACSRSPEVGLRGEAVHQQLAELPPAHSVQVRPHQTVPEFSPLTSFRGTVAQRALRGQEPCAERGACLSCRSELVTDCTPTGDAKVPRCFTAGLQERYRCAREPQGNLTLYDLIKSGQARSDLASTYTTHWGGLCCRSMGAARGNLTLRVWPHPYGRQQPAGELMLRQ